MNIGEASKRTGLPIKTIRYYEEIGLLVADRKANGYRDYSIDHVSQLVFVKRAREFGFPLDECERLLALFNNKDRASADVKALAGRRLEDLKLKAVEIEHLASTLEHLVNSCLGDGKPDCPIIEELAHNPSRALDATAIPPTDEDPAEKSNR